MRGSVRNMTAMMAGAFAVLFGFAQPTVAGAHTLSRLVIQGGVVPDIRVTTSAGRVIAVAQYANAARVGSNDSGKTAIDTLILYGVPKSICAGDWPRILQHFSWRAEPPQVYLAATDLAVDPKQISSSREWISAHWLKTERPYTLGTDASVSLYALPHGKRNPGASLAIVHVDAPHIRTGIVYPALSHGVHEWPREHDVLILQMSVLESAIDARALTVLDPDVAVLLGDAAAPESAKLTELIDQLQEMWVDVYRVSGKGPLIILAGPHGLFLSINGKRLSRAGEESWR